MCILPRYKKNEVSTFKSSLYLQRYYCCISPLCSKLIDGSGCTVLFALFGPEQSLLRFLHLSLTPSLLLLPLLLEATLDLEPHLECLPVLIPGFKKDDRDLSGTRKETDTISKQRQPIPTPRLGKVFHQRKHRQKQAELRVLLNPVYQLVL